MNKAAALAQESLYRPEDWQAALNILGDQADLLLPIVKSIMVIFGYNPFDASSLVWRAYSEG